MLPFVPRKVAKRLPPKIASADLQKDSQSAGPSTSAASAAAIPAVLQQHGAADFKGKEKANCSTLASEEYAALFMLSLSDYALWSSPDLRRVVETSDGGYVPLSYIIHESPYFSALPNAPSEASLFKAIRAHVAEVVDVRVLMSSPSRADWFGRHAPSQDLGGYEFRLKDIDNILQRVSDCPKRDWDAKTLYMENIPLGYRTAHGTHAFVVSLLEDATLSVQPDAIQNIAFPRHHQDRPEDRPKCKGFALVTLSNTELVERLLADWPWTRATAGKEQLGSGSEQANLRRREAFKFGFRTTEKAKWEKLNEEYLAYRQRLLNGIAEANAAEASVPTPVPAKSSTKPVQTEQTVEPARRPATQSVAFSSAHSSETFPHGCLVFVRHVHPETNKTTLRKLFSHALKDIEIPVQGDPIDYVDFNKGIESCYLRLASPEVTKCVVSHFAEHPTAQRQGLDDTGCPPASNRKAIIVEIVSGEREELYWGKVPEKIRRQAIEKASGVVIPVETSRDDAQETSGRKRKRRRG